MFEFSYGLDRFGSFCPMVIDIENEFTIKELVPYSTWTSFNRIDYFTHDTLRGFGIYELVVNRKIIPFVVKYACNIRNQTVSQALDGNISDVGRKFDNDIAIKDIIPRIGGTRVSYFRYNYLKFFPDHNENPAFYKFQDTNEYEEIVQLIKDGLSLLFYADRQSIFNFLSDAEPWNLSQEINRQNAMGVNHKAIFQSPQKLSNYFLDKMSDNSWFNMLGDEAKLDAEKLLAEFLDSGKTLSDLLSFIERYMNDRALAEDNNSYAYKKSHFAIIDFFVYLLMRSNHTCLTEIKMLLKQTENDIRLKKDKIINVLKNNALNYERAMNEFQKLSLQEKAPKIEIILKVLFQNEVYTNTSPELGFDLRILSEPMFLDCIYRSYIQHYKKTFTSSDHMRIEITSLIVDRMIRFKY